MKHARPDYNRIQDPENKIPVDEPVFIIRAQDSVGATAVRMWAVLNDFVFGDPKLSKLARDHAHLMDTWSKKKPADLGNISRIEMELNECLTAKHFDCCCGMTNMEISLPLTDEDIKKLEEEQKTISIEPGQASYKGYK